MELNNLRLDFVEEEEIDGGAQTESVAKNKKYSCFGCMLIGQDEYRKVSSNVKEFT